MGGIVSMRLKVYERTGIKEETKRKVNQAKLIERQISEQEIKRSVELGKYRESCQDKYNLDLMDFEREYERTRNLLWSYRIDEENINDLIIGYSEYLNIYGSSMTALGLRGFRKSIESGVRMARNAEKQKMEAQMETVVENAVIDFVIEYYDEIESLRGQIKLSDIIYLMMELNLDIRNQRTCDEIKVKVKTIYDELKNG